MRIRKNSKMLTIISVTLIVSAILILKGVDTIVGSSFENVSSGNWSDASIWAKGRIPQTGDRIEIKEGTHVIYDVMSEENIAGLDIYGTLTFNRQVSTNLDVGTVMVHTVGTLEVGTAENPIHKGITASIRIVNDKLMAAAAAVSMIRVRIMDRLSSVARSLSPKIRLDAISAPEQMIQACQSSTCG